MDELLRSIQSKYPALAGYDWSVIDSRGKPSKHGGQIEFYSPDEQYNPTPGRPTVEVFNKDLQGDMLERAIFGDMLHYMPEADEGFRGMREKFRATLTPEQLMVDRMAYKKSGDKRDFDKWMDISRLDGYLRGFLAPDANDEWRDAYTDEQKAILGEIDSYLRRPRQAATPSATGSMIDAMGLAR